MNHLLRAVEMQAASQECSHSCLLEPTDQKGLTQGKNIFEFQEEVREFILYADSDWRL